MDRIRKLLSLTLAVACVLFCAAGVAADMIYVPMDEFCLEHLNECEYHDRSYVTNGPGGDVVVYVSPESEEVVTVLENGLEVYISYVYRDGEGELWGCWEHWKADQSGWIPMYYLELIYDGRSFDAEFGTQFLQEPGMLSEEYTGQEIYFWEYPGSSKGYPTLFSDIQAPEYYVVFEDESGLRWGKVRYYMSASGWINLDNPTADFDTLFPTEPSQVTEESTAPSSGNVSGEGVNVTAVTIGAVAAVAAATVALLFLLKRKK